METPRPEDIRLQEIEQKLQAVYVSVEKTRKYFLYTLIATLVTVVLPIIGLAFVLPSFLSSFSSLSGL